MFFSIAATLESISPFSVVFLVRLFAEKYGGGNFFFFFLMWKCNSTITFKGRSSFRFGQLLDIYIFFNLIEMKKLTCDTKDLVLSVNHLV